MILIVGLGNPGPRYADTRHNIGFVVADHLFVSARASLWAKRFSGDFVQVELGGQRAALLKPMEFMNRSGHSVAAAASFYKLASSDILVIHDELDLPFGAVRLKKGGGEAGHNGLRSISAALGTQEYVRARIGIGKPPPDFRGSGADFVLEAFAVTERAALDDLVGRAADAVTLVATRGLDEAMNLTNRRIKN